MNKDSSRSHCLFTVHVECQTSEEKGKDRVTAGKLNLVDLAGSER
jgi:kinesin family protein 3/17